MKPELQSFYLSLLLDAMCVDVSKITSKEFIRFHFPDSARYSEEFGMVLDFAINKELIKNTDPLSFSYRLTLKGLWLHYLFENKVLTMENSLI